MEIFDIIMCILVVAILVAAAWVVYIFRNNQKLNKKIQSHYDRIVQKKTEEDKQ
ncbi:MAG: hypothetical protein MJY95_04115 [Bacteroidaceae bacterium]|nr:hypothetical protein [Bacteroidaceae bacterium]